MGIPVDVRATGGVTSGCRAKKGRSQSNVYAGPGSSLRRSRAEATESGIVRASGRRRGSGKKKKKEKKFNKNPRPKKLQNLEQAQERRTDPRPTGVPGGLVQCRTHIRSNNKTGLAWLQPSAQCRAWKRENEEKLPGMELFSDPWMRAGAVRVRKHVRLRPAPG